MGRAFVLVLVVISVIWIPIVEAFKDGQLFNYIQAVTAFLAPPVCAVYVLGIFVPATNEPVSIVLIIVLLLIIIMICQGAFWGLMVGFVVGIIKFVLDIVYGPPACDEPDLRPYIIAKVTTHIQDQVEKDSANSQVHYLHFAILLFAITVIVTLVISAVTPQKPTPEQVPRVPWHTIRAMPNWTPSSTSSPSGPGTAGATRLRPSP